MSLKILFLEHDGKPSLKRITGAIFLATGWFGKICLCIYAAQHINETLANFTNIDSSCEGFIYSGVALLFGAIADKFFKKNDKGNTDIT